MIQRSTNHQRVAQTDQKEGRKKEDKKPLMDLFKIRGGKPLNGEINVQGAKNEALQILCATLITPEAVTVHNLPLIRDVLKLISLLEGLGVEVTKKNHHTYTFKANDINLDYLSSKEFRKTGSSIRGSVMILGPLLARFKKGIAARPGGDKIGRRRLDTHFLAFQKMGARFNFDEENSCFRIEADNLKGTFIHMEEPSVTGTANIVMAATMAEGTTTIYHAACEPYVQQLCRMLNAMGANISGIGTNKLQIEGVDSLGGCEHTCLPDMIEVGSFIGMAAMTESEITIKNVGYDHLGLIPDTFRKLGIELERKNDDIFIPRQEIYEVETYIDGSILTLYDHPWPGFTPDLLSIILVTAIQAKGNVLVHQKMFESRLFFVDNLIDMGAQIILCDPHRATVIGMGKSQKLKGIKMRSPDIRAGVALLIAALSAEGESIIYNIGQIDRGYEDIDGRLSNLGADIVRISDE